MEFRDDDDDDDGGGFRWKLGGIFIFLRWL
jgi:hypothetical protein